MSSKITSVSDIKNSSDVLKLIFDCAGNWNTQLACVSKTWKGVFEKHLFTEWQALEKVAGPDLLRKMRDVKQCNSRKAPVGRLFCDLKTLLKEIAPPTDPVGLASSLNKWIAAGRQFFAKKVTAAPEHGIVPTFLKGQQTSDAYNREKLLLGLKNRGEDLVNLDDFKGSYYLGLEGLRLTEFHLAIAKKSVVHLRLNQNPYLRSLPIEIMDNQELKILVIEPNLFGQLQGKIRDHLEIMERLGRILIWSEEKVLHVFDREFYSASERKSGRIAIIIQAMGRQPSLFYKELTFVSRSALGKLYQAAYQQKSKEEVSALFADLSESDKKSIQYYIWYLNGSPKDVGENWGFEHAFDDVILLCKAADRTICDRLLSLSEGKRNQIYGIIHRLAKDQNPPDAFWSERDSDWGRTNTLANLGRLADALMYLDKEAL